MKWIKRIALVIALLPIILLALLIGLLIAWPLDILNNIKTAIAFRRFCRREAGRMFLVCTSRRNWHTFLNNNVIPILPEGMRVVWAKSGRSDPYVKFFVDVEHRGYIAVPRPYIVVVTDHTVRAKSLNSQLQEWKARPKKSACTQWACREIIDNVLKELRTVP